MIKTFKDKETEKLYNAGHSRKFHAIEMPALRKLDILAAAVTLADLKVPPGNHLESLRGDREGQYSIRINGQFRVCFEWSKSYAFNVEITDYH